MKQLLLGNEAVARGLYEAGVRVVSSYPGTPSTEITEAAAKFEEMYCEWAPNEKVAAEVAAGASTYDEHTGLLVDCRDMLDKAGADIKEPGVFAKMAAKLQTATF